MCVHSETNNPILEHPEKLNWSENGVQELLCESIFVDMNNQIHVDTKDLNVIHLNVRGINSKVTDLKYLIEHSLYGSPVDIIALCETWLTKYLPIPNIPGYKFIQKCRENKHGGGGVALLISNHINYKILPEIQYNDASIESCFIKIKLNARQILVGSCYRPPNTDPKLFMKLHRNLFSTLLKRNKLMILCMNHNLDLLKSHYHKNNQDFMEANLSSKLYPTIIRPTRIMKATATLIDNIFVRLDTYSSCRSWYFCEAIVSLILNSC